MKNALSRKILAIAMVLMMVASLIPIVSLMAVADDSSITYTLDATADLTAMDKGAKEDGDTEKAGKEDYFTIYYSASTKIDGSNKTFEDGYSATQRLNMGGKP